MGTKSSKVARFLTVSITVFSLLASGLGFQIKPAEAALTAVGPVLDPVNDGFPQFFSDENGLALQLCLDQSPAGLCVLTPGFDPLVPPVTPIGTVASGNFPDESFYWIADAILDPGTRIPGANTDVRITYRAALEQAFLGTITPNTQNIFLRVQADVNGLVPNSTYTVDSPYGTFTVDTDATGGGRTRFEDMGVCALGIGCNFTFPFATNPVLQAVTTNVGAFLTWDPAVLPAAPAGFIGDPNISHQVVGGRGGVNSLTVTGPNVDGIGGNTLSTNLFAVSGQLADTLAPVITLLGVNPDTVAQNAIYTDLGATALDNLDGDVTANIQVTGVPVDTATVGAKTITYTVTDNAGNVATLNRTVNVEAQTLTTINVTPVNPSLVASQTQQFSAQALDQLGSPMIPQPTFTWTSGTLATGTIDANGLFTALANGTSLITATSGLVNGTSTVTVSSLAATTVNVSPVNPSILVGGTQQMSAAVFDQLGNPFVGAVTWSSSNPIAGTIDAASGLFTAVAVGSTTVTATSGVATGTSAVSVVIDATAPVITLNGANPVTVTIGDVYVDAGATANDNIDGVITANIVTTGLPINTAAIGSFTVTYNVSDSDGNAATAVTRTVNVAAAPVLTTINVTPATPAVTIGGTQQMSAATLDQFGSAIAGTSIWSSSNPTIGTIDAASGMFTAVAVGTTTVTATSGAVTGTTIATVSATPVVSPAPVAAKNDGGGHKKKKKKKPAIKVTAPKKITVNRGALISFGAKAKSSSKPIVSYSYTFQGVTRSLRNPVFAIPRNIRPGKYSVTVRAINKVGKVKAKTIRITVR